MSDKLRELHIPDGALEGGDAQEYVRFWIRNQQDFVTLYVGGFDPADQEPTMWGYIMADIAKHAVRAMQQDDPSRGTPEQMLAEIERGFRERLASETGISGQISGAQ